MRIVINTDCWKIVKWYRRRFNKPPKNWWHYHVKECAPHCPKNIWEEEERWIG